MLRTTSKKAIENIREFIRMNSYECDTLRTFDTYEEAAAYIISNFKHECGNEIQRVGFINAMCDWLTWLPGCGIGDPMAYYDDCRQHLKEMFEETDAEAAKYTNTQCYDNLRYFVARELNKFNSRRCK